MKNKKSSIFILTVALFLSVITPITYSAQSDDLKNITGGWSERDGYFGGGISVTSMSTASHTGSVESKEVATGVLMSRAVGNTSWDTVYHYTRARFEGYVTGSVTGDSGRVWGWNTTEAKSDWIDTFLTDYVGKTYYGNQ
ncbi:hypothetical protein NQ117_18700 [Paenibacillus sp. SC116]|uniref:hypothetical protein n=1 Tax=Paenibacillus sp. SC116 TaxID=2968986 RepID=UPI00215A5E0D|nr:hypothetical protein [Paenibacillus sp. SC116]MCR8845715.1 hypothetical protein [Paenibacillus sp. SC116]